MANELLDLNYPFLKKEGIAYIRELAGKVWTDYNDHDPGITILEELCFAIMDLEYRTNFYIEDILAPNPDSQKEKNIKQFYDAEAILPCNPLTINDFLKIVIDVPGVKNANIILSGGDQEIKGGYKVFIDIEERVRKNKQEDVLKKKVIDKLHQYRNLCEDFFTVECMALQPIRVQGAFELFYSPAYEEAEAIIAQIYFNIQVFLAPRINFCSLSQMIEKGKTIDDIFTGPLLEQGFIDDVELANSQRIEIYTADLLEQITLLSAIKNVLQFEACIDESSNAKQVTIPIAPCSSLKLVISESNIVLSHNGTPIIIDKEKAMYFFDELVGRTNLNNAYVNKEYVPVHKGRFRNLASHTSIQQDFPLMYNVGKEGTARSAPTTQKAKVKQLKGYLMFFDQLFANYFAQLSNIKHRMAMHSDEWQKPNGQLPEDVPYFESLIRNTSIIDDDAARKEESSTAHATTNVYKKEFEVQQKYLGVLLEGIKHKYTHQSTHKDYVNHLNKLLVTRESNAFSRSKMLDHLLARFSEVFTTYLLSAHAKTETEKLERFNENKSLFLQDYIAISRDRNKGINILDGDLDDWNSENASGFERRIHYKLGIKELKKKFLYDILQRNIYLEKHAVESNVEMFLGKGLQLEYDNVLVFKGKFHKIRDLAIKYGIYEGNYDIVQKENGNYGIRLYIDKAKKNTIDIVDDKKLFLSIEEAEKTIHQSISFFNAFNKASEGFHLIEHILLRNGTTIQENNDPYSFIMTMVFPTWPSRFQNQSFRNAVQEMVILESPAHVFVNILWLDFKEMEAFEKAYKNWIELKKVPQVAPDRLNQAVRSLLGLIMLYTRE